MSTLDSSSFLPVRDSTISYWRATPHELDSYRTADTVPAEVDIAIIGAGLSGVCTAYHILRRPGPKPRVAIFEARESCSGATGRNGGHTKISPLTIKSRYQELGIHHARALSALQEAQLYDMKAVVEREGIDCDFLLTRSYDVIYDAAEAADMKAWLASQAGEAWLRHVQWIEGPNLQRILGIKGAHGATSTRAASLWPYKFVCGLLARCLELGAELYTHTPVTKTTTMAAGRTTLTTARGECVAGMVVHATNGYAASLLPEYHAVLTPVRGTACSIVGASAGPYEGSPPHLPCTYNLRYTPAQIDYMIPRPDGTVVLGGGSNVYRHDRNIWYDTVDDASQIEGVEAHFSKVMPGRFLGWEKARVNMVWTGIMGYTPDMCPHVGRVPGKDGQWMLAGFNGGGMAMILKVAEGVVKMMLDGVGFEETGLPPFLETNEKRKQNTVNLR